ncbi:hypothetical protein Btru_036045 [Bulinus truncatus]|nr:hypothetical protein Btru_036045 [Bulinus truncatus]
MIEGSEETLEYLEFSNANFSALPRALMNLSALRNLTITDTNMASWDAEVLGKLGRNLRSLVLQNVGLTTWPSWLALFPSLDTLTIADDNIDTVPGGTFDKESATLKSLTLFNVNLTTLPVFLESQTGLVELILGKNQLKYLNHLPKQSKLAEISLYKNQISESSTLITELLPYVNTLTSLDLNSNLLNSIPDFFSFKNITLLDLRNNLLSDDNSGSFPPNIKDILLDQNHLKRIPDAVGQHLSVISLEISTNRIIEISNIPEQLTSLDLSDNLLTNITQENFPPNSSLERLLLAKNPITNIDVDSLLRLTQLKYLNLRETQLVRLPLALSALSELTYLDIFDNHGLVCTCEESELVDWYQTRPGLVVDGFCKMLAVSEFLRDTAYECPQLNFTDTVISTAQPVTDVIIG